MMGKNQIMVSVDKEYDQIFEEIFKVNPKFINRKTGKAHKKKITESALDRMFAEESKDIILVKLIICRDCHKKDMIDTLLQMIEGTHDNGSIKTFSHNKITHTN